MLASKRNFVFGTLEPKTLPSSNIAVLNNHCCGRIGGAGDYNLHLPFLRRTLQRGRSIRCGSGRVQILQRHNDHPTRIGWFSSPLSQPSRGFGHRIMQRLWQKLLQPLPLYPHLRKCKAICLSKLSPRTTKQGI